MFLNPKSLGIFALGAVAFSDATASGLLFLKANINPLLGAAGVSAVPGSAREVHVMGQHADPTNSLLMHVMACNSSGVISLAVCAGILWSFLLG